MSRAQPTQATSPTPPPAPQPSPGRLPQPEQLGDSLVGHQRYQAAIAAYSKAPEMTAAIWNKMGIAYQMLFNAKDATRCYKESLKLDPTNAQVMNNLATVYASLKQYGQADRMYRKALKLDPKSAIVLKNYGTNLLAEHKYNRGWEAYQQALAIDPRDLFRSEWSLRAESLQRAGAGRDELLHGGGLRARRLHRLRPPVPPHGPR